MKHPTILKIKDKVLIKFQYQELINLKTDLRAHSNFVANVKTNEKICLTKYDEQSEVEKKLETENLIKASSKSGKPEKFESDALFIYYKERLALEKIVVLNGKFRDIIIKKNEAILECVLDKDCDDFDMEINRINPNGEITALTTLSSNSDRNIKEIIFNWL